MYNSLFWSISPQDAVTQGGFLVDIVDDDILLHSNSPPRGRETTTNVITTTNVMYWGTFGGLMKGFMCY